jgi:flagellar hook-associated protein FlgK
MLPRQNTKKEKLIMANKPYPTDLLEQAQSVLDAWNQIDDGLTYGTVTIATLGADITQSNKLVSDMNVLEAQITDLRNQRDALYAGLWDKVKRVRSGVKATYGDDSSQYEMIGAHV